MTIDEPTDTSLSHREYRDEHRGIFSSHPYWLERGSNFIRLVLVGSAISIYLLVTYLWLRGHGINRMIPALGNWLVSDTGKIVAGIAVFGMGMMTAATFQLRMALRKQSKDLARQRDLPVSFSPGTALVVALADRPQ